ncbi:hypothetical protein ZWY2020_006042 [Hordeum vulgare]|nr:hypothetical protein ZWY2020_006042 [Hordeum vulgare]
MIVLPGRALTASRASGILTRQMGKAGPDQRVPAPTALLIAKVMMKRGMQEVTAAHADGARVVGCANVSSRACASRLCAGTRQAESRSKGDTAVTMPWALARLRLAGMRRRSSMHKKGGRLRQAQPSPSRHQPLPSQLCLSSDNGGWCNTPRQHFDMSQPAWENIAIYRAGFVLVLYQHVKCWRQGGVTYTIAGFNYFELMLITNIADSNSVVMASIKVSSIGWIQMSRNWGANWQCLYGLAGQAPSFAVTTIGRQYLLFEDVVPTWWKFG